MWLDVSFLITKVTIPQTGSLIRIPKTNGEWVKCFGSYKSNKAVFFRDLNLRPRGRGTNTFPPCYTAVRPSNQLRYVQQERTELNCTNQELQGNGWNKLSYQQTCQFWPPPLTLLTSFTFCNPKRCLQPVDFYKIPISPYFLQVVFF